MPEGPEPSGDSVQIPLGLPTIAIIFFSWGRPKILECRFLFPPRVYVVNESINFGSECTKRLCSPEDRLHLQGTRRID